MKILIDTNILIDYFLHRPEFYENSKLVINYCFFIVNGYIAAHSFSDMYYVLHEKEKRDIEYCRTVFLKLCQMFEVCTLDKQRIIEASNNLNFNDFEDSLQSSYAESAGLDYIVTRNISDFKNSSVPAITPEVFISMIN